LNLLNTGIVFVLIIASFQPQLAGKFLNEKSHILIIDDDKALLESCAKIIRHNGDYDVVTLDDSAEAEHEIEKGGYDLVISDLSMPGKSGLDLLKKARLVCPDVPFVLFSAYGNVGTAVEAMRHGAFDFLEKPFKSARMKVVVEKSLQYRRLFKEKQALENQLQSDAGFDDLVGESPVMQRLFELIERVAEGESNIVLFGESGTGKELVARSIHNHSRRKKKAFVPVNCGAFPEHLFESELFGHEKGAFTGAYQRKPGLLEYANGGTFFLDEICELALPMQVKLLRMLQDKKIRHVGGNHEIDVDVRLISASNQNLERAVAKGTLREDLYYRINVISVHIPPLRERQQDILPLCNHFLKKYVKQTPKTILGFADDALRCLENYPWPGNVRELENVIERAVTLAATDLINLLDLPDNLVCKKNLLRNSGTDMPLKTAKKEIIAQFEKEYLVRMLRKHDGHITRAAASSGVDRRTFHRLLSRYHIDAKDLPNGSL